MKRQVVALHLFDKNDIKTEENGNIHHKLKYQPGTTSYKWNQINGIENVDANISLGDKLGLHPANYVTGQFDLFETPDKYIVKDIYNFNPEGTAASKERIKQGNASLYQKIRYAAGTYGLNKDLDGYQEIPKEKIYDWYQEYLNNK